MMLTSDIEIDNSIAMGLRVCTEAQRIAFCIIRIHTLVAMDREWLAYTNIKFISANSLTTVSSYQPSVEGFSWRMPCLMPDVIP